MHIHVRHATNPTDFKKYDTQRIREEFLMEKLFVPDQFHFVYSHYDRMIVGGVKPVGQSHKLPIYEELRADYFLERREIGILNVGGDGTVTVGEEVFTLQKRDCLYVGKGHKQVCFKSLSHESPAKFLLVSTPAHREVPTALMKAADATPAEMGTPETANMRTIYKYIHAEGLESCQLVMGIEETRHLVVANEQAVISPPWSIHAGAGTTSYSFMWAMAGENYTFVDMDLLNLSELR